MQVETSQESQNQKKELSLNKGTPAHSKTLLDDLTSAYLPSKQRRIPQFDLSREKAREDLAKQNYRDELDNLLHAALGLRSNYQAKERDDEI